MQEETKQTPQEKAAQQTLAQAIALSKLDLGTIEAVAAVACSQGLQHFQLSKDTRLPLEARKSHRFVADNLKYFSRKICALVAPTEADADAMVKAIMLQTMEFHRAQLKGVKAHAASQPGPDGTGTA